MFCGALLSWKRTRSIGTGDVAVVLVDAALHLAVGSR
jgi:hypothetical protein